MLILFSKTPVKRDIANATLVLYKLVNNFYSKNIRKIVLFTETIAPLSIKSFKGKPHKLIIEQIERYFVFYVMRNISYINRINLKLKKKNKELPTIKITVNIVKESFVYSFWSKLRISYYVNNWIYTTNHKRIAVNYFWFVILSGIVGMVLATVIRLEFAYPGVGIFAGDSIQYLSLASAHGVIMVFFMIMPLLFGAFANFLLPTQLGVHDVAFPRLNSAAFWFLPGGLLMLCQLVCVDRRYQRMNCFNIREVQSLLKRKFFVDLINTKDYHTFTNEIALSTRFKTNNAHSLNANAHLIYNFGLEFSAKTRKHFFTVMGNSIENKNNEFLFLNLNSLFTKNILFFSNFSFLSHFNIFFFKMFDANWFFLNSNVTSNVTIFSILTSIFYLNFFLYNIKIFFNIFFNLATIITLSPLFLLFNTIFFTLKNLSNPITYNNIYYLIMDNYLYDLMLDFLDYYILDTTDDWYETHMYWKLSNWTPLTSKKWFKLIVESETRTQLWIHLSIVNPFFSNISSLIQKKFEYFTAKQWIITIYDLGLYQKNIFLYLYNLLVLSTLTLINSHVASLFKNINIILQTPKPVTNYYTTIKQKKIHIQISKLIENNYPFSILNSNSILENFFFLFYYFFNLMSLLLSFTSTLINKQITNLQFQLENIYWLNLYFFNLFNLYDFYLYSYARIFCFYNLFDNKLTLLALSELIVQKLIKINDLIYFNYKSWNIFFTDSFNFFNFSSVYVINVTLQFLQKFINIFQEFYTHPIKQIYNKNIKFYDIQIIKLKLNLQNWEKLFFNSSFFTDIDVKNTFLIANEESSEKSRNNKFTDPIFKYDFKSGDYFPKLNKDVYNFLFSTILDTTNALKPTPWFFSNNAKDLFVLNFTDFFENFSNKLSDNNIELRKFSLNKFAPTNSFYNFFASFIDNKSYVNNNWINLENLNFKFSKMFNSNSMQQRIYSNWRQLKFTREAWRCKLLTARHQKTLYRRYLNEDGVFWSIERNAKDLIPGWAMITPFSSRTRFTAIGKTDIGLLAVLLVLNSSIVSAANFLVTYRYLSTLNNRKMRDARAFFTEAVMVASWMMILANPMLVIGIIMLLSDRHWQTSFFDYSGGGDTVLFQHMFWFFGHPEVYIIILPTFGFTNTMLSYYLKKRVSARASLLYSMYTIAFLGFFVWGHHMYMVGLSHTTRMLFSTLTVMISVPAATKIMHWCVTTVNSAFTMELPLLFTFTFIFFFVSGGISGMCVAHTGMDILFHDTFYVIGHFHVMLAGGAMFASFGAFYFYFPAIFGVKYSRIYAYLHYSYYLIGQLMTIVPMFWLGYAGMPRRVLDYPTPFGGWHSVISAGHMLNVAGLMAFFFMIFDSLRQARAATRNHFGIARFNTRLNFYLYETTRSIYLKQKTLFLFRFVKPSRIKLNQYSFINYEPFETTLLSYIFFKK
jgi:heme/copper-type cytochrome/quinol oxidase subunit 1